MAIATFNEEKNLAECLASISQLADEIVVVDGGSKDATVQLAKQLGAKVVVTTNPPIFHINKQKAIDLATKDWILQLDADERVTTELAEEIKRVISLSEDELEQYQKDIPKRHLFLRHQKLLTQRDGPIGSETGDYSAFFVPRKNFFLGRFLLYGGVYPDGVIRLFKKGKALFPSKSVHEQIVVDGKVGWLSHDLVHMADADFSRYITRWSRYIKLISDELRQSPPGLAGSIDYLLFKPMYWFLLTFVRHKGFMDSWQGFVFSFFSALRFPAAYFKYITKS